MTQRIPDEFISDKDKTETSIYALNSNQPFLKVFPWVPSTMQIAVPDLPNDVEMRVRIRSARQVQANILCEVLVPQFEIVGTSAIVASAIVAPFAMGMPSLGVLAKLREPKIEEAIDVANHVRPHELTKAVRDRIALHSRFKSFLLRRDRLKQFKQLFEI